MTDILTAMTPIDWLGVLGSLIIAAAYFAVSAGKVAADRPMFHLINLAGALMILVSLYIRPNAGAIMMELLWIIIAVFGLVRYVLRNRS